MSRRDPRHRYPPFTQPRANLLPFADHLHFTGRIRVYRKSSVTGVFRPHTCRNAMRYFCQTLRFRKRKRLLRRLRGEYRDSKGRPKIRLPRRSGASSRYAQRDAVA